MSKSETKPPHMREFPVEGSDGYIYRPERRTHEIQPQLLGAPFHRYQCGKCKSFIWYDESCGHWHHWERRG